MKLAPLFAFALLMPVTACDLAAGEDSDEETGSGSGSDSGGVTGEVPGNDYCDPVSDWPTTHTQLEADILTIVNQRRAEGANCGSEGDFPPVGPLSMNSALNCAARVHSKDMVDRDYFDHTNLDGLSPWDRMDLAGYNWSAAGENIAAGSPDAAGTMNQWMNSDGHCANIMSGDFTELGVGYYPGGEWGHMWTQVFGRPQ